MGKHRADNVTEDARANGNDRTAANRTKASTAAANRTKTSAAATNRAKATAAANRATANRATTLTARAKKPAAIFAALTMVITTLVGVGLLTAPQASADDTLEINGYNKTFFVNDTRDIADNNPGDGECKTSDNVDDYIDGKPPCTMYAAIQEANARPSGESILITVADRLYTIYEYEKYLDRDGDDPAQPKQPVFTTPANRLQRTGTVWLNWDTQIQNSEGTRLGALQNPHGVPNMITSKEDLRNEAGTWEGAYNDNEGARYVVKHDHVTIDLQNRMRFLTDVDAPSVVTFLFNGKNQKIRNFDQISSGTTVLEVGAKAENTVIQNGELTNIPATDGTAPAESGVVVVGGAKNTLIEDLYMNNMFWGNVIAAPADKKSPHKGKPIEGLTLKDLTWKHSDGVNRELRPYGFGTIRDYETDNYAVVNNLHVTGLHAINYVAFLYGVNDSFMAAPLYFNRMRLNNAVVENCDFYIDKPVYPSPEHPPTPLSIYMGSNLDVNSTIDIRKNTFRWNSREKSTVDHMNTTYAPWYTWIYAGMSAGAKGVSIHDNEIDGVFDSGPQIAVGMTDTEFKVYRNTMINIGGPVSGSRYKLDNINYSDRMAFRNNFWLTPDKQYEPSGHDVNPFNLVKETTISSSTINNNLGDHVTVDPTDFTREHAGTVKVKAKIWMKNSSGIGSGKKYNIDFSDWPLCVDAYIGTNREPGIDGQYSDPYQGQYIQTYLGRHCWTAADIPTNYSSDYFYDDVEFPYSGDLLDMNADRRIRFQMLDGHNRSIRYSNRSNSYQDLYNLGGEDSLETWIVRKGWTHDHEEGEGVQPNETFDRFATFRIYTSQSVVPQQLFDAISFREVEPGGMDYQDGDSSGTEWAPKKMRLPNDKFDPAYFRQISRNTFEIKVKRSSTGTITPYVQADKFYPSDLLNPDGTPRDGAPANTESNTTPAPTDFAGTTDAEGLQRQPIVDSDVSVHYTVPLILTAEDGTGANLDELDITEGSPAVKAFKLTNSVTENVNGYPQVTKAPIGPIMIEFDKTKGSSTVQNDPVLAAQGHAAPDQNIEDAIDIVGIGANKNSIDPVMRSYERDLDIYVRAKDDTIVNGQRKATFAVKITAPEDPEFQGLYLDYKDFKLTIHDNDRPVQNAKELTTKATVDTNNQLANGTAANKAHIDVRNNGVEANTTAIPPIAAKDPQLVSNAKVTVTVPQVQGMTVTCSAPDCSKSTIDASASEEAARTFTYITTTEQAPITATSTKAGTFTFNYKVETKDATRPSSPDIVKTFDLTFVPNPVSQSNSYFDVSTGEREVPSGKHTVTVVLKDAENKPISGVTTQQIKASTTAQNVTIGGFTEVTSQPGTYTADVTATQKVTAPISVVAKALGPDKQDVTLIVGGNNNRDAVFVNAPQVSAENSSFDVNQTPKTADGATAVPMTVSLNDDKTPSKPISGTVTIVVPSDVTLSATECEVAGSTQPTQNTYNCQISDSGSLNANLTSTKAGDYAVSVSIPSGNSSVALTSADGHDTAHFVAGDPSTTTDDGQNCSDNQPPSYMSVTTNGQKADGDKQDVVKVVLRDKFCNPVIYSNPASSITLGSLPSGLTVKTAFTKEGSGEGVFYQAGIASTKAGTFAVKTATPLVLGPVSLNFISGDVDNSKSTFTVSTHDQTKVADGQDAHTITVTLADSQGNYVCNADVAKLHVSTTGMTLTNTVQAGTFTKVAATTTTPCTYTASLTSTEAGTATVTVKYGDQTATALANTPTGTNTAPFKAGDVNVQHSAFKVSTGQKPVGTAASDEGHTITALLKDTNDNPVTDATQCAKLNATQTGLTGENVAISAFTYADNSQGECVATIKSTQAGQATVAVTFNGTGLGHGTDNDKATFTALNTPDLDDNAHSNFTVSTGEKVVGNAHTVTVKLADKYGNPISGLAEKLSGSVEGLAGATVGQTFTESQTKGTYTADVTSETAGTGIVTIAYDTNKPVKKKADGNDQAVFVADTVDLDDATHSYFNVASKEAIEVGTNHTINVRLADKFNNPVSVDPVQLLAQQTGIDPAAVAISSFTKVSNGQGGFKPGQYTATITSTKPGNAKVSVTLTGKGNVKLTVTAEKNDTARFKASSPVINADPSVTPDGGDPGTCPGGKKASYINAADGAVANGSAVNKVTIVLRDKFCNPVTITDLSTLRASAGDAVTIGSFTAASTAGTYQADATSRTAGTYTVTGNLSEPALALGSDDTTFVPGDVSAANSEVIVINKDSASQNDTSQITAGNKIAIKVTPKDETGNKVDVGDTLDVLVPGFEGGPKTVTLTKGDDGVYSNDPVTVQPTKVTQRPPADGVITFPTGSPLAGKTHNLAVVAGPADEANRDGGNQITGETGTQIDNPGTVSVTDKYDNPVAEGTPVWVKVPGQSDPVKKTADANGKVTIPSFTPTGAAGEKVEVFKGNADNSAPDTSAAIGTIPVSSNTGDPNATNSTLKAEGNPPVGGTGPDKDYAQEGKPVKVTGELKDGAGTPNKLANHSPLTIKVTQTVNGEETTQTIDAKTDENGQLVATDGSAITFTAGDVNTDNEVELYTVAADAIAGAQPLKTVTIRSGKNAEKAIKVVTANSVVTISAGPKPVSKNDDPDAKYTVTAKLFNKYNEQIDLSKLTQEQQNAELSKLAISVAEPYTLSATGQNMWASGFAVEAGEVGAQAPARGAVTNVASTLAGTAHLTVTYGGTALRQEGQSASDTVLDAVFTAGDATEGADPSVKPGGDETSGQCPDGNRASYATATSGAVADGHATNTVTAHFRDKFCNPVDVQGVSGTGAKLTVGAFTKSSTGVYTAPVTSTTAGTHNDVVVTSTTPAVSTAATSTTFVAGPVDLSNAEYTHFYVKDPTGEREANGIAAHYVCARVSDANGNPVTLSDPTTLVMEQTGLDADKVNRGAFAANDGSISAVADDTGCKYVASITSTQAGTAKVKVKYTGQNLYLKPESNADTAKFKVGGVDTNKSDFVVSDGNKTANGTDTHTVTVTLRDGQGNGVPGKVAELAKATQTGLTGVTISDFSDKGQGVYVATIASTKAGNATMAVSYSGTPLTVKSGANDVAHFVAGPLDTNATTVKVTANNVETASVKAGTPVVVTLTPVDKDGNTVDLGNGPIKVTVPGVEGDVTMTKSPDGKTWTADATPVTPTPQRLTTGKEDKVYFKDNTTLAGVQTTLAVTVGDVDTDKSDFVVSEGNKTANGTDTHTVTVTLRDGQGNGVPGKVAELAKATQTGLTGVTISDFSDKGQGVYEATIASTKAGNATMAASYNGTALPVKKLDGGQQDANKVAHFVAGPADLSDASHSHISVAPNSLTANNSDSATVTVVLADEHGNPVTGQATHLGDAAHKPTQTGIDQGVTFTAFEEGTPGTYTATITSSKAGTATVSAGLDGIDIPLKAGANRAVTFSAGEPDLTDTNHSNFVVSDGVHVANTNNPHTITVVLKDEQGNPVTGRADNLAASQSTVTGADASKVTISSFSEGSNGTYTATVTSTKAADITIAVTYTNGTAASVKVKEQGKDVARFGAGVADLTTSTITVQKNDEGGSPTGADISEARVGDSLTITVVPKDAQGNTNPKNIGDTLVVNVPGVAEPVTLTKDTQDPTAYVGTVAPTTPTVAPLNQITFPDDSPLAGKRHQLDVLPGSPKSAVYDGDGPITGVPSQKVTNPGKFVVKDGPNGTGNPVGAGETVYVWVPGATTPTKRITDGDGKVVIPDFTPSDAANQQVKVTSDAAGQTSLGSVDVSVSPGDPNGENSKLTLTPQTPSAEDPDLPAEGSTVTVGGVLKDGAPQPNLIKNRTTDLSVVVTKDGVKGNPILVKTDDSGQIVDRTTGEAITFEAAAYNKLNKVELFTNDQGSGTALTSAQVMSGRDPVEAEKPVFSDDPSTSSLAFINDDVTKKADNVETHMVEVHLKNKYGDMIGGKASKLSLRLKSGVDANSGYVDSGTGANVTYGEGFSAGVKTRSIDSTTAYTNTIASTKAGTPVFEAVYTDGGTTTVVPAAKNVSPYELRSPQGLPAPFEAGGVDQSQSELVVTQLNGDPIPAEGIVAGTSVKIVYHPKDANGNPLTLPSGTRVVVPVPTPTGTRDVTLVADDTTFVTPAEGTRMTKAGTHTLTAKVNDSTGPSADPFKVNAGQPDSNATTITYAPAVPKPGDLTTVTVTVKDEFGNPVDKGTKVKVKLPGETTPTTYVIGEDGVAYTDNGSGQPTTTKPTFTPTTSGKHSIVVTTANDIPLKTKDVKVKPAAPTNLKASATKVTGDVDAGVADNSTVTVTKGTQTVGTGTVTGGTFTVTYGTGYTPNSDDTLSVTVTDAVTGLTSDPATTSPSTGQPKTPTVETSPDEPNTISGTVTPGTTVKVCVYGSDGVLKKCYTPPNDNGNYEVTTDTPLVDGDKVTVTSTDPDSGNTADKTVTIDRVGPAAPTVTAADPATDGSVTVTITPADKDDVSGKPIVKFGDTVVSADKVTCDATSKVCTVVVPVSERKNGPVTVKAAYKDPTGNTGTEGSVTVPKANTPQVTDVKANKTQVTGKVPKSVPVGSTITLTDPDDNPIGSGTVVADPKDPNNNTFVADYEGYTPQPNDKVKVTVTDKDTSVTSDPVEVTVDATTPVVTPDISNGKKVTGTVTDSGVYEDGEQPTVTVHYVDANNTPKTVEATVSCTDKADGSKECTFQADLPTGAKEPIKVVATDPSGNATDPVPVTVDSTDPTVTPTFTPAKGSAKDKVSTTVSDDHGLGDEPKATVTYTKADGTPGEQQVDLTCNTEKTSCSFTDYELPGGAKDGTTITVKVSDKAGNTTEGTTVADKSTATPQVDAGDGVTGTTVTVTAEPGSTVTITYKDQDGTNQTQTCSEKPGNLGTYECVLDKTVKNGETVNAHVTDPLGNEADGQSTPVNRAAIVITPKPTNGTKVTGTVSDPTATVTVEYYEKGGDQKKVTPATVNKTTRTIVAKLGNNTDTDKPIMIVAEKNGDTYSAQVPIDLDGPGTPHDIEVSKDGRTITGKIDKPADEGTTVTVTLPNGKTVTGTVNEDEGTFTVVIPADKPALQEGDTITIVAEDPAGNTGEATHTVDNKNTVSAKVNEDGTKVTGTTDPGSTVTVKDKDGNQIGDPVVADSNGNFEVDIPADKKPTAGDKFTVTSEDPRGNTIEDTIIYTPRQPSPPVIDEIKDDTVTGKTEPGTTVKLCVTRTSGAKECVDAQVEDNGTFVVTIPGGALNPGEKICLTATNPATGAVSKPTTYIEPIPTPVAPAASKLSKTGSDAQSLVWIAYILVMVGGGLLVANRRRQRQ